MQADLRLCWSHKPLCWKSHVTAHIKFTKSAMHMVISYIAYYENSKNARPLMEYVFAIKSQAYRQHSPVLCTCISMDLLWDTAEIKTWHRPSGQPAPLLNPPLLWPMALLGSVEIPHSLQKCSYHSLHRCIIDKRNQSESVRFVSKLFDKMLISNKTC